MKSTRKFLYMLLALVMIMSICAVSHAFAADVEYCTREGCDGICEWRDEDPLGCILKRGLYCTTCGTRILGEDIPNHDYREYARVDATCSKTGMVYYICNNRECNLVKTEVLPIVPDAHYFSSWVVEKEATCKDTGSMYRVCKNEDENGTACTYIETQLIPFNTNAHVFNGEWTRVSEPTCEADGVEKTVCTVCEKAESTRPIPAHSNTWVVDESRSYEATCATTGLNYVACEKCNFNGTVILPKNDNHRWTVKEVIKEATCTEEGVSKMCCVYHRDVEKTEDTPKTEHVSSGEWTTVLAVNCKVEGKEAILCKNCSAEIETRALPKREHTPGTWLIKSGDCANGGIAYRNCIYCNMPMDEAVPFAAGTHLNRRVATFNPTCTKDGYTVEWCSDCKMEFSDRVIIPAEHVMSDERTLIKDSTCDQVGLETGKCLRCLQTVNFEIPKKTHYFIVKTPGTPATCLKDGISDELFCTKCGIIESQVVLKATGHYDGDNNGCCDWCYSYTVEKEDGTSVLCDCFCHNNSIFAQILFKIFNFFYKLFGINQTCECGKIHY